MWRRKERWKKKTLGWTNAYVKGIERRQCGEADIQTEDAFPCLKSRA
jgi:hypothetical protein